MYSNNIVKIPESTTIVNACSKKCLEIYWIHHVAKILDCTHKVSKYQLQVRYYDHFRTNPPGKSMKPFLSP